MTALLRQTEFPSFDNDDLDDALLCSIVAGDFSKERDLLIAPPKDAHSIEGWIWVPHDISSKAAVENTAA